MTNTRGYPRAGSEKFVPVPVPAIYSTRITRTRQTQNPRGFGNSSSHHLKYITHFVNVRKLTNKLSN